MGHRFEDLVAWQKARSLAVRVYRMTQATAMTRDFGFKSQIQRAAVSIMANIAEGQERGSVADFVRFLRIAKASCAELRSHLFLAGDIGYADAESIRSLQSDANEVARIIGGLIQSMKRKQIQSQACSREPATLTNEATG